jgi:hypothetical protein
MLLLIFNLQVVVVGCLWFFFWKFQFSLVLLLEFILFQIDGCLSLFDIFLVASVLAHMGGCAKSVCIYECVHVLDLCILEGS